MLDRIGVIGYGNIGKRHADIIQNRAILDFVCDIDTSKINISEVDVYESYLSALSLCSADIIAVCTPNNTHYKIALDCIKHGYDVIIEKPMALSASHAVELSQTAKLLNRKIYVVKQNRYSEPIQWIKSALPEMGKLLMIDVNCYWNRNKNYYDQSKWRSKKWDSGGVVFTQFSHFIDIIYYLFGYAEVQKNISENLLHPYTNFSDCGSVLFSAMGALGAFNYTTCSTNKNLESSITIIAEKATIKIGGQYMNQVVFCEGVEKPTFEAISGNQYGLYQGSASNHDQLYQNVINSRLGKERYIVDYEQAPQVVKMCEAFS